MAEPLLNDFVFHWERSFPGDEMPALSFLEALRIPESTSQEVWNVMETDLKSLSIEKNTLEKQLDRVQFCLTWLNGRKLSHDDGNSEQNGTGKESGEEEVAIFNGENVEVPARNQRSCSLINHRVQVLLPSDEIRRLSAGNSGCSHLTKDDILHLAKISERRQKSYENVRLSMGLGLTDVRSLPPPPKLPIKALDKSTNGQENQEKEVVHSKHFTETLNKLCDAIPKQKEESVLFNLGYPCDGNDLRNCLLSEAKVTEANTELLVSALTDAGLGHLVETLTNLDHNVNRTYLNEDDSKKDLRHEKPRLKKKPKDLVLHLHERLSSESGISGRCSSPLDSPLTPCGFAFHFGIKVTSDYRPSSGSSEPNWGAFRRFILIRGQRMDVIGLHGERTVHEQYICRNTETEMGLVPKEKCEVMYEAPPIIWEKEWFVTPEKAAKYAELMAHAQTGTFYVRNCHRKTGDFSLIVKTGQISTKFQIGVNGSHYTISPANRGTRSFLSFDELIEFYKTHCLTTDKQTNICLTIPMKRIEAASK